MCQFLQIESFAVVLWFEVKGFPERDSKLDAPQTTKLVLSNFLSNCSNWGISSCKKMKEWLIICDNLRISYFEPWFLPSSNFNVNFVTDATRNFYGFDLEWRCKSDRDNIIITTYVVSLLFLTTMTFLLALRKWMSPKTWTWRYLQFVLEDFE